MVTCVRQERLVNTGIIHTLVHTHFTYNAAIVLLVPLAEIVLDSICTGGSSTFVVLETTGTCFLEVNKI